jgi:hypothetical protein
MSAPVYQPIEMIMAASLPTLIYPILRYVPHTDNTDKSQKIAIYLQLPKWPAADRESHIARPIWPQGQSRVTARIKAPV